MIANQMRMFDVCSRRLLPSTVLKEGDFLVTPRLPGEAFVVLKINPSGEINLGSLFQNCKGTIDTLIADAFEFKYPNKG
jgi:hypothetical protein